MPIFSSPLLRLRRQLPFCSRPRPWPGLHFPAAPSVPATPEGLFAQRLPQSQMRTCPGVLPSTVDVSRIKLCFCPRVPLLWHTSSGDRGLHAWGTEGRQALTGAGWGLGRG